MVGAAVILIVLVVILPVATLMSGAVAAAVLGGYLSHRVEQDHEGSELVALNR